MLYVDNCVFACIPTVAPDAAGSQIPVFVVSSVPSLADLWKESVTQSMLELDMVVEQDYATDIFSDMMVRKLLRAVRLHLGNQISL